MTSRLVRILAATGTAAAVVLGLSACGVSVAKEDLAQSVTAKLAEQKVEAAGMTCPENLKGETGASVTCQYTTAAGQPVDVVVSVTSVDGSTVNYTAQPKARPLLPAVVAKSVTADLAKQNVEAKDLQCPSELPAQQGASIECAFTADGQPVGAKVTVTAVEDANVSYDVELVAKPVSKDLLQQTLTEQIGRQAGVTISSTACAGDLQPQVGAQTSCTVTAPGEQVEFDVAVTAVNSGLVNFAWTPKI
ncbi:hypothetical protein Psed_5371 [Pseudonocardia dioxanivorans CB1190]|uniref:DUF4333 domain-containing protein n=1 Tax=Pseudonocardia dioxanivorans (strain ATCC 55486 / DSM 44775 / JCM 13855 / CB1190) TaxID=675635 RepID=F4CW87_PSEUX|nr:DUF4333 domain-containing protein [Pseudonocardia dioxanivorans]AEA27505.1 hypothetical protein Psed_5371 [Pseudonocardia dioxanivorans CB1190]GJF06882.1 hypothetical protein PSD17_58290 [Pseudonocardia sp. D17]